MPLEAADLDRLLDHVDGHIDDSLTRLFDFLAIPSISTDPAYAEECGRAAEWLAGELAALGFEAGARPTGGHPMVTGHRTVEGRPTALFYGHYDVQPVDPLELWDTGPFEPTLVERDGVRHIAARGSSDDKGQVMTFVEACRAFLAVTGELPVGVKFLVEGEEESASVSFAPFIKRHAGDFAADLALVCDTDMWDPRTPSIITSLRGLVAEEIEITCADRDLHSGSYGNAALNPNQVLAEIVASLRNPDGSVAIDGFYDEVRVVPANVRATWEELGFDNEGYLAGVNLTTPAGEKGWSVFEQTTARPTCEINGISGGYAGEGFKTVIPSKARAKISFRLVADMDPDKVRAAFRRHVTDRLPPDARVAFTDHGGASAVAAPFSGPFIDRARKALADEWQAEPVLHGSGGSIPAVETIKTELGLDALLIGFARDDDNVHSPNEKYDLESFHRGIRSWVRILAELA